MRDESWKRLVTQNTSEHGERSHTIRSLFPSLTIQPDLQSSIFGNHDARRLFEQALMMEANKTSLVVEKWKPNHTEVITPSVECWLGGWLTR